MPPRVARRLTRQFDAARKMAALLGGEAIELTRIVVGERGDHRLGVIDEE